MMMMGDSDASTQAIQEQLAVLQDLAGAIQWDLLLKCLKQKNSIESVIHMKKFGSLLKKLDFTQDNVRNDINDCIRILTQIFVIIDPKGALCRTTASILQGLPSDYQQQIIRKLEESLIAELNAYNDKNMQYTVAKVYLIGAYMENFPLGRRCLDSCVEQVLEFLTKALEKYLNFTRANFTSTTNQTVRMHNCLATIKTTMATIQQCSHSISKELKTSTCRASIKMFMELAWEVLSDGMFIADCRSTAGMAVPIGIKMLLENENSLPSQLMNLIFTTSKDNEIYPQMSPTKTQLADMRCFKSSDDFRNRLPSSQLFLCHGVLALLRTADLIKIVEGRGCLLLDVILPEIFGIAQSITDSSTTLAASRTLTLWTSVALSAVQEHPDIEHVKCALVGSSHIPQRLIQYVWTNWDHPIDGMRHQTRLIFDNIVAIHLIVTTDSIASIADSFLLKLLQDLIGVSWHVRGKYGPLGSLVQHLGTERILGLFPTMHHTILDMLREQTIVPYACDLLTKLFTNHLTAVQGIELSVWQDTWVLPALNILCDQNIPQHHKGFMVEYYLPKLLKFNPDSLSYIVHHLQRSSRLSTKSDQLGPLLTCLKTARSLGLIKSGGDGGGKMQDGGMWKGLVSIGVLEQALCHQIPQVQLNALGLLCNSNKTTERFSTIELRLLSKFMSLNMNNPSSSFRQQMCSHLKKMLIRLRESGRVAIKQQSCKKDKKKQDEDMKQVESLISEYKNFLGWFCDLQFSSLNPGCCYSRRASALHILTLVLQIFNDPHKQGKYQGIFQTEDMWTPSNVDLLMTKLTDNYESNKVMAFDLLNGLSQHTLGLMNKYHLDAMYRCSLQLACSNKPHSCETASYILRVLSRQLQQPLKVAATNLEQCILGILDDLCGLLKGHISIARDSLLEASIQGPMYGILHCIRELTKDVHFKSVTSRSEWRSMLQTIISLCFDVAKLASTVVCNSSPEGYLPTDSTDISEPGSSNESPADLDKRSVEVTTLQVTPQMILVCCWRSMKEVSLLLGELSLNVPVCDVDDSGDEESQGLITETQIVEIGALFLQLLKKSVHRGAFELAYVGFVKLCTNLWRNRSQSLQQLPKQWLDSLMYDITSDQPTLCSTRRSAGIPFAIQAILNSEPVGFSKQHFKLTMSSLLKLALPDASMAGQVSSTSQVHGLNILRALYKDTHHGEDVFPYVADGVMAAILGFQAKLWAVRNSATMLFSALITRIFGVKRGKEEQARKNCMTGREFFSRFPALHGFLLSQLVEATQKIDSSATAHLHPGLFPVLLLLSRLFPSAMDGNNSSLSMAVFVPHVLRCAGSAVFKTRCIASRALVAVVPRGNVPDMLKQLIGCLPQRLDGSAGVINHNYIHGILLQIQYFLDAQDSVTSNEEMQSSISSILPQLHSSLWLITSDNHCYTTRVAMANILNKFVLNHSQFSSTYDSKESPLRKLKMTVCNIVQRNITEAFDDIKDKHQPGFTDWQTAHTQMGLSFIQDDDALKNLTNDFTVSSAGEIADHFENPSKRSCEMPDRATHPSTPSCDIENKTSLIPDDCGRSKEEGSGKSRMTIPLIVNFLSSPYYEVRELALKTLYDDSNQSNDDNSLVGCSQSKLWSKVIDSQEVFQVLVTMAIEWEDHPACISKALLLLAHHPLSITSPWQLADNIHLSIVECFNKILKIASLANQRDDIVCAAIEMTSSLIPAVYLMLNEEKNEPETISFQAWTNLVKCYSDAEQTSQSRLTVANILGKLASTVLVDSKQLLGYDITSTLWCIVIELLQDDDSSVQNAACHCIKQAMETLPSSGISDSYPQTAFQPALALEVGLSIMTRIYANTFPTRYVQTLIDWLIGTSEGDQCIMGSEDTPEDHGNEQAPEDKLFDRGECNTNYERLLLGKAILTQLQNLAYATTTAITTNTSQTGLAKATDLDTDPSLDISKSATRTTHPSDSGPEMAFEPTDQFLSGKAAKFGSGYGSSMCNPPAELSIVVDKASNTRQCLVNASCGKMDTILINIDYFLANLSDVSMATPFLDTTAYEENCVQCWCLLASLLGLSLIIGSEGISRDGRLGKIQKIIRLVVDKFGGNSERCNALITNIITELRGTL